MPDGFDPEMMSNAIVVTRLPDEELNGVTVAVFQTTLDLSGVMSNPAVMDMMMQQMMMNINAHRTNTRAGTAKRRGSGQMLPVLQPAEVRSDD